MKGLRKLVTAMLLLGAFSSLLVSCGEEKIPVKVMKVEKKPIEAFAYANGEVSAEQIEEVIFQPGAIINEVLVKEGDYVTEGQRLAIYDTDKVRQAPMSGVVTEINVRRGSAYAQGRPGFVIMDTKSLIVKANVKQIDSPNVRTGQEVNIFGDSYGKENKFKGKVDYVSEVAKNIGDQPFVEVKVRLDEPVPSYLKHGMKVTCDIQLSRKEDALVVTYATIKEVGNDKFVYAVKNGRLDERKVKIGASYGIYAELLEGVNVGDEIVMDPKENFKSGLSVEIVGRI